MINHKIFNFDMDLESLRSNISLGLIALALIGAYLPGKASSFFIVPALFVLWAERSLVHIDSEMKRVFLFYLAYLILFTVTSQDIFRSLDGVYHVVRGLLFFPLALVFAQLAGKRGLIIVNALAMFCIAGNLCFERLAVGSTGAQTYFFSYYINPNNAGVHFLGLMVLALPYFRPNIPKFSNWILSSIGVLMGLYLLVLTNARGAWMGLVCGIILLLVIKRGLPSWIRIACGAICIASLSILLIFYNIKGFDLNLRGVLWKGLFDATIRDHLLLGHGIDLVKQVIIKNELITATAHNIFLEVFTCSGLLGIAWILTVTFRSIRHLLRFSYRQNSLWCMGIVGLFAFLAMAQFDLKLFAFRFTASISFFLGLIYSQRKISTDFSRMNSTS